jgi:hypothetical protein
MKPGDALSYQLQRTNQGTDVEVKATLVKAPQKALAEMIADHKAAAHKSDKAEASTKS